MDDLGSVVRGYLRTGEQLRWAGRPDPRVWFTRADLYIVPLSLAYLSFSLSWEYGTLTDHLAPPRSNEHRYGLFFNLWGIPFIVTGLYFVLGRFFVKWRRKRQTTYGVTDQRALVCIGSGMVIDVPVHGQARTVRRSFTGRHVDVVWNAATRSAYRRGFPGNTGMGGLIATRDGLPMAFYDVADGDALLDALDVAEASHGIPPKIRGHREHPSHDDD